MGTLQKLQNAAARLVTEKSKYSHITPVLRDLHWLPVKLKIEYKLASLVYKCLHGLAPTYLSEHCITVSKNPNRLRLRSAAAHQLMIPRTNTNIESS